MKKLIYRIVIMLLIGSLLISSYFIFKYNREDKEQEEIYEEISKIAQESSEKSENKEDDIKMEDLYKVNNDIVAWLKIEDTQINFPVMQTKDRKNYYLHKDFYKNYSLWGTPFLAENCNIKTSDNLIIYGHHIKNYKMFGELEKYTSRKFYTEHKYIQFYTLEEKSKYEIIYIFRTAVDGSFEYYNFIKANNEAEFETFVKKCEKLSLFSIDKRAKYGDKLITLSTCDYTTKNGRLVVVAKKI